jgi:Tol biopolymer transport system component
VENAFELQLVNERPAGQPRTISDVGDLGTMALSPDGRYLVYHRNIHDQRDLWIGSASGGPLRRLVDDPAADVDPAWSPDGSHLAFSSNRAGSFDLWVLPMKDGHASGPAERLSALPGSEILPVWSPDGTSIAYIGEETFASDAWVVGTRAGEKPRRLTSGAQAVRVAWSPWPGSLLVSGTWGGNEMEVRRVHLDTGATESLVPRLSLGDQGAFGDFSVDTQNGLLACPIDRSKGHVWVLLASSGRF